MEVLKRFIIENDTRFKKQVEIVIKYDYETDTPDFDYGSFEDNQKEMSRFESGELLNLYVLVEAKIGHLSGSDSLGQVFVKASNFDQDIMETIESYNMVEHAINDLMTDIERTKQLIEEAV